MIIRARHLAIVALGLVSVSALAQTKAKSIYSSTDVMVQVVPGTNPKLLDAAIGAVEVSNIPQIGWRKVRVPVSFGAARAMQYYRQSKNVLEATRVTKYEIEATVSDPLATQQYSLTRMNMPKAWDITVGKPTTVIAVLDTGVQLSHEDLKNKVVKGYDFSDDDDDVNPDSKTENGDYHGTHVAGIAAADTNNSRGIAGIGYNCMVMPLKVFPNSYDDVIAKAVIYAADNGARVITMSLGGYGSPNPAFQAAVNYAYNKGSIITASAGNDGTNNDTRPHYPSDYNNVICVGSSDRFDQKSTFSNYGLRVDIAAPGTDILSTLAETDSKYGPLDGTSMATPQIAGLLGLMASYYPSATNAQLRTALLRGTDKIGSWVATGRANAVKALTLLRPASPTLSKTVASSIYGKSLATSDLAKLATKGDGKSVSVPMTYESGLGQTGMYVAEFQGPVTENWTDFVESRLELSATLKAEQSTIQVYIWDYRANSYKVVTQATMQSSIQMSFKLPINQSQYRAQDGSGRYRIMVRGLIPNRTGNPRSGSKMVLDYLASTTTFLQ